MRIGNIKIFFILILAILMIAGCNNESATIENQTAEDKGNVDNKEATDTELRIAINAQPATLDQHLVSATATRDTGRMIYETLLTTNSKYEAIPMLAESVEVSEDGKTYTFNLRKGVKFHNGEEMTSEDVVASMYRWLDKSPVTGSIFDGVIFESKDDYTTVLEISQPSGLVLDSLASPKQAPAIMPKEVIEAETSDGLQEYIGTGPYKFVEWQQDQFIHFTKFEDYQAVDQESDGLAGKKEALIKDIYFDIVTDPSTRLAGIQTGTYDIIYQIPYDDYEKVESDPDITPYLDTGGELVFLYNKVAGPGSEFKIREAINAALNMEEILLAAFTNEKIYDFSAGYMNNDMSNWASDAGIEFYNQNDVEKAKEILAEVGYDGEPFRIMATRDYPAYYNAAVVIQEQLTQIGMNVELEVFDWATFNERLEDPNNWDSLVVGISLVSTPIQLVQINPTFAGGVGDQKIIDLLEEIERSPNQEEAKQLWDELQGYAWEHHLPLTMLGSYNNLFAASNKVEGFEVSSGPILWNTTVVK